MMQAQYQSYPHYARHYAPFGSYPQATPYPAASRPVPPQAGQYGYNGYPQAPVNYGKDSTPFIPPSLDLPTGQATGAKAKRNRADLKPLKSAMKKNFEAAFMPDPSPQTANQVPGRGRTKGRNTRDQILKPEPVDQLPPQLPVDKSIDPFEPYHMFVSLRGTSDIVMEHVNEPALEEIRHEIYEPWGIEADELDGYTWRVRLRHQPWSDTSPQKSKAWEMLVRLFTLFTQRGYIFQSTIHTGSPVPRLLFVKSEPEPAPRFLLAFFSRRGRRVTLVNPPPSVTSGFHSRLSQYLPGRVTYEETTVNGTRLLSCTCPQAPGEVFLMGSTGHFILLVLKTLCDSEHYLETTIPMAPWLSVGPVQLGPRRHLYLFKGGNKQ